MQQLTPADYFALPRRPVLLDVRSPAEYAAGHIEGAINLPLFSDAERAEVGTRYKQVGADDALLRGLEFVGPKMRALVEAARAAAPDGEAVVQCWRAGQRSASVAWLLSQGGMRVSRLRGGYKAYRAFARHYLAHQPYTLRVLSGPTGSGKTHVLHALRELGAAMVDLEGLANHKGSSFGALGEDEQPTTEAFENKLFAAFHALPKGTPVWVEDESRMIGTVCQPEVFYDRLVHSSPVELQMPLDWRVENLVSDYSRYPKPLLVDAFTRLRKRLGGQHLQVALDALEQADYHTACRVALVYYDKAYAHYATQRPTAAQVRVTATSRDPIAIARQLLSVC